MSNRIAIVGSREFPSERAVRQYVRRLPLSTVIVSGGARGVDSWGASEAGARGMAVRTFRPIMVGGEWLIVDSLDGSLTGTSGAYGTGGAFQSFGHAAYARNELIVDNADAVVAFWDGKSRGTQSTVKLAIAAKLPYAVIVPNGDRFAVESSEALEDLWIYARSGH